MEGYRRKHIEGMAGFIILNDGRAWAAANWAYDAAISHIAQSLPPTPEGIELSKWLLEQTCEVRGMGLGSVDLRELTPRNQSLFIDAAREAVVKANTRGAEEWADAPYFQAWEERFGVLLKLIESFERGEPASDFNPHMEGLTPPTGERSGPGWNQ